MIGETAEAVSSRLMYGGSAVAGGSWAACKVPILQQIVERLGIVEWSDVTGSAGALIAFAGLLMNFWFNLRRDRREERAQKAKEAA